MVPREHNEEGGSAFPRAAAVAEVGWGVDSEFEDEFEDEFWDDFEGEGGEGVEEIDMDVDAERLAVGGLQGQAQVDDAQVDHAVLVEAVIDGKWVQTTGVVVVCPSEVAATGVETARVDAVEMVGSDSEGEPGLAAHLGPKSHREYQELFPAGSSQRGAHAEGGAAPNGRASNGNAPKRARLERHELLDELRKENERSAELRRLAGTFLERAAQARSFVHALLPLAQVVRPEGLSEPPSCLCDLPPLPGPSFEAALEAVLSQESGGSLS